MGIFLKEVRASRIPHPTQQRFSIELWEGAYNSVSPHDEEDHHLFQAGLWVFNKLNAIRSKLDEISFRNISSSVIIRFMCGYLNRVDHIISQKELPLVNEDTLIAESLIQMKIPENIPYPDATPDELTIAAIDGARYPISFVQSLIENSTAQKQNDLEILDVIRKTMMLGSFYDSIETIWMDCLWLGKYIQAKSDYDLIIDSDIEAAINRAVTDYRRQSLMLQFFTLSMNAWKRSVSEEIKRDIYNNAFEVGIKKQQKKKKLSLLPMKYDAEFPPPNHIATIWAQESYYQKLFKVKLPNYHDFTLEQLLTAWQILHGLARRLFNVFPKDSGVYKVNKLLQYAPTIARDEIADLFSQAMQVSYKKGEQLLNIFIYKGSIRDELWFYPLVALDENKVCPVMSVLLHPNLLRTIEHWLAKSGINIDSKGGEFEKEIIEELKEAIQEATQKGNLKDIEVYSISKNTFGEQIDLIIKLRNTFLLGEAKCALYPAEPLEFYRYYEVIKGDAAPQIKRKVDYVNHNRELFLQVLGLADRMSPSHIKVIPFIFTNHPYCVGFPIEDVPVVDRYILGRYIDSGGYDRFVFLGKDGTKSVGEKIIFYNSEEEAEEKIESYLLKPPQMDLIKKCISYRTVPIPMLNEADKKALFITIDVELPVPGDDKGQNHQKP